MEITLKSGDKNTIRHIVKAEETAQAMRSGGLPVFATPMMILLMEHTAFHLAKKAGYETVGTLVNVKHCKACLQGTEVVSEAEIVEIDGRRIVFNVKVSDGEAILGEGLHERFVIDPERFMSKLNKK